MAGPAPVEQTATPVIMDEETRRAEQAVAKAVTQAGIRVDRQSVTPDHTHILEAIGSVASEGFQDAGRLASGAMGGDAHIDIAGPSKTTPLVLERARMGGKFTSFLETMGLKRKAA